MRVDLTAFLSGTGHIKDKRPKGSRNSDKRILPTPSLQFYQPACRPSSAAIVSGKRSAGATTLISAKLRKRLGSRSPWPASFRMRAARTPLSCEARASGDSFAQVSSRTFARNVIISGSNDPASEDPMTATLMSHAGTNVPPLIRRLSARYPAYLLNFFASDDRRGAGECRRPDICDGQCRARTANWVCRSLRDTSVLPPQRQERYGKVFPFPQSLAGVAGSGRL